MQPIKYTFTRFPTLKTFQITARNGHILDMKQRRVARPTCAGSKAEEHKAAGGPGGGAARGFAQLGLALACCTGRRASYETKASVAVEGVSAGVGGFRRRGTAELTGMCGATENASRSEE